MAALCAGRRPRRIPARQQENSRLWLEARTFPASLQTRDGPSPAVTNAESYRSASLPRRQTLRFGKQRMGQDAWTLNAPTWPHAPNGGAGLVPGAGQGCWPGNDWPPSGAPVRGW